MSNTEFGVSIADELVEELDELTEECVDLQASRSEVVEAILTAYFQSDVDRKITVPCNFYLPVNSQCNSAVNS